MKTRICSMAAKLSHVASLAAIVALSGCVQTSPKFDSGFGSSVRTSVAAQVADPSAVRNTNAVTGIDGRAAAAAQQRYENSFAQPSAQQSVMPGLK